MTERNGLIVFAVVVTYFPQWAQLEKLLSLLTKQVAHVLVVDNTPAISHETRLIYDRIKMGGLKLDKLEVIRLGRNSGVATALNIGIRAARSSGATHILLSDQDSEPCVDMVEGLLRSEQELTRRGIKVGAIGPSFVNTNSGEHYSFHTTTADSLLRWRRAASPQRPFVEALSLITSGTLIRVSTLDIVGLMRDDWFIDCVDIEWCYRARQYGFHVYGTYWAKMVHRMGDAPLRVWFLCWIEANVHSPLRIYYQVRNLVRLHYMGCGGIRWRLANIFSIAAIFYCHVLFGSERMAALRMGSRGLVDGLRGHMGMLSS